ncbi:MAG: YicC family protein [Cocleimonas sp.]|nr:YicC family protein [Cocleimonas sp.]
MSTPNSKIKSMTAYARGHFSNDQGRIEWEIHSVNHRYLDVKLNLPNTLLSYQNSLKTQVGKQLKRGKIEARLRYESNHQYADEILINQDIVKALLAAQRKIETLSLKPTSLSTFEILSWPEVIETLETDVSCLIEPIQDLLEQTLNDLVATREREGQRLAVFISLRCDEAEQIIDSVKLRYKAVLIALREKVLKRLTELDLDINENRLEQELVIQAQRLDIDEEIDRLSAHIQEIKLVLQRQDPVGRRLDFLMQEMNREVNTIGSKSHDTLTTQAVVDLKVRVEQMREQIQNIE